MKSSLRLLIFVVGFGLISAKVWSDCGSKIGTISAVRISGCDDTMNECVLKRNTNVSIEVDLTANQDITKLNTVVHGIMMGMPVPFPLPNPDACKGAGLDCPLKASNKYNYKAVMTVLKAYPKVTLEVKWELQDEKEVDLLCLMIPAKIQ